MALVLKTSWLVAAGALANATQPVVSVIEASGGVSVIATNSSPADYTMTMVIRTKNLQPALPKPITKSMGPDEVVELARFARQDAEIGWNVDYDFRCTWGHIAAQPDYSAIYRLPYLSGEAYRVSQGYFGSFTHNGAEAFAIDWSMPVGTPVTASRDGVVAGVKIDSNDGGRGLEFDSAANFILIRHADGAYAQYSHLKYGGAVVALGDQVTAGEIIGYSGATGNVTGPHLHFAVFKGKNGRQRETIPVSFMTGKGVVSHVKTGDVFVAPADRRPALGIASVALDD